MAADPRWCVAAVSLWTSLGFLLGSAEYLLPPSNIRVGMKDDMFCLVWGWDPPENSNCSTLIYTSDIRSRQPTSRRAVSTIGTAHIRNVDFNEEFTIEVTAQCEGLSSQNSLTMKLETGDPKTAVRNFNCIWHNLEYVSCTWEPGPAAPPSADYSLVYWSSSIIQCYVQEFSQSRPFRDWLRDGNRCQNFTHSGGVATGCRFPFQKSLNKQDNLLIVVADWSRNVTPYFYYVNSNSILKLNPPVIQEAYRTEHQSIYVSWNNSIVDIHLMYEVKVEMSNSKKSLDYTDIMGLSKEIQNIKSDLTYKVKVRVRLSKDSVDGNAYLWSDWCEERILPGQDGGRVGSLLLLLLIPAVVVVAAIVLLIYIKRLKILLVPRIPDPGKVLSNDLQQWIKSGRMAYSEIRREEICPVSLLETTTTPNTE